MPEGIRRGTELGCTALQVFVKSPNQWKARPIAETEATAFRTAYGASKVGPLAAHAAYLINLAAPVPEILEKSREALADELGRCDALGIPGLVVHPGAFLTRTADEGLTAIAESLDAILASRKGKPSKILVELTAGQGSVLGRSLDELRIIRDRTKRGSEIGFCLDTCHAYAGGYDIASKSGWSDFLAAVERTIGFESIGCVHLNDSQHELGSKKDRHANIGEGKIGAKPFSWFITEKKLAHVPMVLETPLGDDEQGHARDLKTLRKLLG